MFAFFAVYPPTEVVSFGLSIPTLFSSLLGSEHMFFIYYHMLRILVTIVVHGILPLGYFIFIGTFSDQLLFDRAKLSIWWHIYFNFSILIALLAFSLAFYWKRNYFSQHPVAVKLKRFSSNSF
jgi:hypothetical protein